jgi:hypothetical protein
MDQVAATDASLGPDTPGEAAFRRHMLGLPRREPGAALIEELRERFTVIAGRLEDLAGGLVQSASATAPSKKSEIEAGCASAVRGIAAAAREALAAVPPGGSGQETDRVFTPEQVGAVAGGTLAAIAKPQRREIDELRAQLEAATCERDKALAMAVDTADRDEYQLVVAEMIAAHEHVGDDHRPRLG